MPAFVEMLRKNWGQGTLPFYYVQIAPYKYGVPDLVGGSALLREAQMRNLDEIPASGMVVTLDIGNKTCIHPARKAQVGQRLAWLALYNDYGIRGFEPNAPVYESMSVEGNRALLTFRTGKSSLAPLGDELAGFEVAGADRVFHPAKAWIDGRKGVLIVSSEEVPTPVAVRYAFRNYAEASPLQHQRHSRLVVPHRRLGTARQIIRQPPGGGWSKAKEARRGAKNKIGPDSAGPPMKKPCPVNPEQGFSGRSHADGTPAADPPPSEQRLEDLHGIECRPLLDLVAHAPERQAVFIGQILADAAHVDGILAGDEQRHRVNLVGRIVHQHHARRLGQMPREPPRPKPDARSRARRSPNGPASPAPVRRWPTHGYRSA